MSLPNHFELLATDGAARTGRLTTPHGVVRTPAFMPVGTAGAMKGMHWREVRDAGADIVLGNTYHLMLRPGAERIAALGGLQAFTGSADGELGGSRAVITRHDAVPRASAQQPFARRRLRHMMAEGGPSSKTRLPARD